MRYDPSSFWTSGGSVAEASAKIDMSLDQLLAATLRATACNIAAVFLMENGNYRRVAASGAAPAERIEAVPAKTKTRTFKRAFQISPCRHSTPPLHLQVDGQNLDCFAAGSAFNCEDGTSGLLVVVDDFPRCRLSVAQAYVLEAQAAHCRTILQLQSLRFIATRDAKDGAGVSSDRMHLLESVAVHARDSIIITEAEPLDLPGPRILFCNAAFTRATGYSAEEVLGKTPRLLQGPDTSADARAKMREAFSQWQAIEVELVNYRKDGTPFWVELSIVPVANERGWFTHWVSVQRDISKRKAAEEVATRMRVAVAEKNKVLASEILERKRVEAELLYTAFHDNLTRLRNRAFFMQRLAHAIDKQKVVSDYSYAVLFLDLDRFKVVNDSLGHPAGDTLLKEVARRLKKSTRPQDTLARIGGDEFAVLIDSTELDASISAAERIIEALRAPVRLGRQEVFPGCSIGIVQSYSQYASPEELLRDADIAMYEAKNTGHGTYAVFNESMHADAVKKLELQTDLRRACDRGEFEVVYQSILSLSAHRVSGFEALLRWRHPERGLLSPAVFIDAAEEIGLIRQIGRWVRIEACNQLKKWQLAYDRPDLQMSINVSATEFADRGYTTELADLLSTLKLSPKSVQLEITEGIFLDPTSSMMDTVKQVRQLGVLIALDDFGTGYSSLSYINRYSIDAIKIDQSFVADMSVNTRTFAIIELIVHLGRALNVAIIAEGVETQVQETILVAMGCGFGQGYHFAEPASAQTAERLLAEPVNAEKHAA